MTRESESNAKNGNMLYLIAVPIDFVLLSISIQQRQ